MAGARGVHLYDGVGYMESTTAGIGQIASLLRATVDIAAAEATALGREAAAWHPTDGAWCVNAVLGHLIEAEQRGFAGRIRLILDQDRPLLPGWDQPAVALARRDCERPAGALAAEFSRLRLAGIALLDRLVPAELERTGMHPDVGELSVRDLLHEWVFHDREHLRQLLENTRALLWPAMGNARRFTDPGA